MARLGFTIDLANAEKHDLVMLIRAGEPLPEKYRFVLFEDKREVELMWNGKTRDACKSQVFCDGGQLYKASKSKAGVVSRDQLTTTWTEWVDHQERMAKRSHTARPCARTDDRAAHLRAALPLSSGREGDRHLRHRHDDVRAGERRTVPVP